MIAIVQLQLIATPWSVSVYYQRKINLTYISYFATILQLSKGL